MVNLILCTCYCDKKMPKIMRNVDKLVLGNIITHISYIVHIGCVGPTHPLSWSVMVSSNGGVMCDIFGRWVTYYFITITMQ